MVQWFDTPFLCPLSMPFRQSRQMRQLRSHLSSIPMSWQGRLCLQQLSMRRFMLNNNCSSYAYSLNSQSLLYRMHEPQERVEFFHSQSSFGSESNLSESRYYDFTNELIAETDNVFLTLKRQLLPNETQSQQEKIEYALRRAQILHKDTIPEHAAYLNKIDAPANAKQQVALCSEKLAKLLADHQKLKNGTMIYKQFYNVYGKQFGLQSGTFSRKKEALQIEPEPQEFIKPECIQINYNEGRQKLTAATPRVFVAAPQINNDKQLAGLREEIYKLKKTVEENKKKYQLELTDQQLAFEKRMRTYLTMPSTTAQSQENLNEELKQNSQKIEKLLSQNKELKETIEENTKTIDNLKSQNHLFKEQIEGLRKAENNLNQYQDAVNKSYNSQANQNQDKKLQKLLKNLMQQNELLKNQLKTQRQRFYRMQSDLTQQERRELQRNRKNLQKKRNQLQQLYADFDRQRIEILQLSHSCKTNDKMIESLKRQNEELKNKIRTKNTSQQVVPTAPTLLSFSKNQKSMELSRANKIQILQYEGDGIEGFPYYDILSKQFKIRFKRACLKDKELLYKANGIQIGAISNFESSNKVNILVHLTNYSEKVFEKVKIKVMNANQNKIQGNSFQYASIVENQQIKLPITISIHQYPIGPLILLLEYTQEKKEEIRILLPAHIFKTMIIDERDDNINAANSNKLTIITERKICRDLNDLKKYLKVDKVGKISLFNEHTHTLFYLDLIQAQNGIDLVYEHKEGSKFITDYFIKTFAFLVGKDTTR